MVSPPSLQVSGDGPAEGWVSLRSRGHPLLAKRAAKKAGVVRLTRGCALGGL